MKRYEFSFVQSGYGETLEEAVADALHSLATQDFPEDEAIVLRVEDYPDMIDDYGKGE